MSWADSRIGIVPPFPGKGVVGRTTTRAVQGFAIRLVGLRQGKFAGFVHHLAYRAEGIGQEVFGSCRALLGDTHVAVQIRMRAVIQHLGQAGSQVKRVVGRRTTGGL